VRVTCDICNVFYEGTPEYCSKFVIVSLTRKKELRCQCRNHLIDYQTKLMSSMGVTVEQMSRYVLTNRLTCSNCGKELYDADETCCNHITKCVYCGDWLEPDEWHIKRTYPNQKCFHDVRCKCFKCDFQPVPNYYIELFKIWWVSGHWVIQFPRLMLLYICSIKIWWVSGHWVIQFPRLMLLYICSIFALHNCTLEPLPSPTRTLKCDSGQVGLSPAGGMTCIGEVDGNPRSK
jgi:hypothetical protein